MKINAKRTKGYYGEWTMHCCTVPFFLPNRVYTMLPFVYLSRWLKQ